MRNALLVVITLHLSLVTTHTVPRVTGSEVPAASAINTNSLPRGAQGSVSVVDYGAKGDGVSDSRAAIQKAVDSLEGGGVVEFPRGNYAISGPIVLKGRSGVVLRGMGSQVSRLLAMSADSTMVVIDESNYCGVEDMALVHAPDAGSNTGDMCWQKDRCLERVLESSKRHAPQAYSRKRDSDRVYLTEAPRTAPTNGSAIVVTRSYSTTVRSIYVERVWRAMEISHMANVVTVTDSIFLSIYGPQCFMLTGGEDGHRVDIVQMARITTNQADPNANPKVVWIDVGPGVNTVRLDNVGLINGGTGLKMWAHSDEPAGLFPGRPLFVFCNDLEIDFPSMDALALMQGESVFLSNAYIQGAKAGSGILTGPEWNSELQVVNSRIFGHGRHGVHLQGGRTTVLSNNIIGRNSIAAAAQSHGVYITGATTDVTVSGNHIGMVMNGSQDTQKHGVFIEGSAVDSYVITGNNCAHNSGRGVVDLSDSPNHIISNNLMGTQESMLV